MNSLYISSNINVMAELSSPIREICTHAYFDPVKKAKLKAVHKVRNKDLVLSLVLGWHFWDSSHQRM